MKPRIIIIAVIVAIVGICAPMFFVPSDKVLIHDALQESIKASRDGRPGGVLDFLSKSLKINDNESESRWSVADFIKKSRPDVEIENQEPQIEGETARIVSPVTVSLGLGPVQTPIRLEKVDIRLQKEMGTKFLIFPSPKWRIVRINLSEEDYGKFSQ